MGALFSIAKIIAWARSLNLFGIQPAVLLEPRQLNQSSQKPDIPDSYLIPTLMRTISELWEAFYDPEKCALDYQALKESAQYARYKELAAQLSEFDPGRLQTREAKLAFWINLYNAMVVHGIVEMGVKNSNREAPGFFEALYYMIGGEDYGLDDIEHGILRGNARPPRRLGKVFKPDDPRLRHSIKGLVDPRIHFALVPGFRSSPPLRFYEEDYIDQQLETAVHAFIGSPEIEISPEKNQAVLSQIFRWYSWDFGGKRGGLRFLLPYIADGSKRMYLKENLGKIRIVYSDSDWNLNQ